ncbi:MAG: hypothetical protein OEO19_07455 [Gammaproteobacteria bacterium]|nr:hypothetical protein [Gammaproteobacteria bacterium]MDH3449181.1 hypothetical protein [Gammaproteobacteria bacterium]
MRYTILIAIAGLLLIACATTRKPFVPPVDSNFSAQIQITFDSLPNYTRLYFQNGMQIAEKDLDRWTTYCRLHIFNRDKKADYLASVRPGRFGISSVKNYARSSDGINYLPGLQMFLGFGLATSRSGTRSDWEYDGPPDYYLYQVEMKLTSTDQPDVQFLTCSRKWSTRGDYFPTLAAMRRALGNLILLEPMSVSTAFKRSLRASL